MNAQAAPPVKSGELYEVSIDAVGGKGDGIAKVKGFVIFVPGVQKGDYVKIKVSKVLQNVGFGEVVEKLDHAPVKEQKYATVSRQEMHEQEPEQKYEDTEDFGE